MNAKTTLPDRPGSGPAGSAFTDVDLGELAAGINEITTRKNKLHTRPPDKPQRLPDRDTTRPVSTTTGNSPNRGSDDRGNTGHDTGSTEHNTENSIEPDSLTAFKALPLHRIKLNPEQPRKHYDKDGIRELARSIKHYGLLQPVVVRKESDQSYVLLAGQRRYNACKLLDIDTIPAHIRHVDQDADSFIIAMSENLQRKNIDRLEEAQGYQFLIDHYDMSHSEVADKTGFSKTHITRVLKLNSMPDDIKHIYKSGKTADLKTLIALHKLKQQNPVKYHKVVLKDSIGRVEVEESLKIPEPTGDFSETTAEASTNRDSRTKQEPLLDAHIIEDIANEALAHAHKVNLKQVFGETPSTVSLYTAIMGKCSDVNRTIIALLKCRAILQYRLKRLNNTSRKH